MTNESRSRDFLLTFCIVPDSVGITLDFSWLEPASTSEADKGTAETARQFRVSMPLLFVAAGSVPYAIVPNRPSKSLKL